MCEFIDLPPEFTPLHGGQMVRIDLRNSGKGTNGPETTFSFVMPRSVFMASIGGAKETLETMMKGDADAYVAALPRSRESA